MVELPEWMGLEGLPWLFTAVQMHLHWGSGGPSHGGSEHTINGLSADAEVCLNTAQYKQWKAQSSLGGVTIVLMECQYFMIILTYFEW